MAAEFSLVDVEEVENYFSCSDADLPMHYGQEEEHQSCFCLL